MSSFLERRSGNGGGGRRKWSTVAGALSTFLLIVVVPFTDALPKPAVHVPLQSATHRSLHRHHHARLGLPEKILVLRGGGDVKSTSRRQRNPAISASRYATTIHGGAESHIDKTDAWDLSDITAMDIVYTGIYAALLAGVVLFCRNGSRSGGLAPEWMTTSEWMPEPYGTVVLHIAFFAIGALLRWILPEGLCKIVFTPPSVALLGSVFPAVESVRAAVTDSGADDRTWLMYWVMHGLFQYSTEFIDQLALKYEIIYRYWHTFEVLAILWLILPITDGSTLIYKTVAKPYLVPLFVPVKNMCDGWIAAIALTTINASYLWWFSFIFMSLPVAIKRYAVIGVGSIFPLAATTMAVTTTKENEEMRWLTYWPCFSLLFNIMIGVEKFIGSFKGLYVACLAATLYLMLPMFDGSTVIFRKILVPLLGQRELLLLRDARSLAADLFKHVPAERQEAARQSAARAFLPE